MRVCRGICLIVRELKEFRKDVVDGVRSAIGGKFPHADVDDAGGADYDSGNSVPFAVENKEGDKVDHMLLMPNPVSIEILGLANRGEIDKARSLINKLMRNLGVGRA